MDSNPVSHSTLSLQQRSLDQNVYWVARRDNIPYCGFPCKKPVTLLSYLPVLYLFQELHSKLEVTAKVLKDNQEASARELINQQAKLREVSCA